MVAFRNLACAAWVCVCLAACNGGGGGGDAGDGDVTVRDAADVGADVEAGIDAIDAPDVFTRDVMVEAAVLCGSITECTSCNSTAGCGWCGSSSQCMSGTASGATSGACASGWSFYAAACMSTGDGGAGLTWTVEHLPGAGTVDGLWGTSSGVYAAAEGGIFFRGTDGTWSMQYPVDTALSVWGSSPTDVYVAARRTPGSVILHGDGLGHWTEQFATAGRTDVTDIRAVWGSQADDVWAVGDLLLPPNGVILHSSGDGSWRIAQTFPVTSLQLLSISGSGPNDIDVVGQPNALYHFDGTSWAPSMMFTDNPGSVWVADATDIYVGGAQGVWFSPGDDTWTEQVDPLLNFEPQALGGTSRSDVYAAGILRGTTSPAVVLHSGDGMNWTMVPVPPQMLFNSVWASAPTNVYIGANGGVVVHGTM